MHETDGFAPMSLQGERRDFFDLIEQGGAAKCPCCDRTARIYRRKLNSQMAQFLGLIYRAAAFEAIVGKPQYSTGEDGFTKGSPLEYFPEKTYTKTLPEIEVGASMVWIDTRNLRWICQGHKASTDGTYLTKWGLVEKKKGHTGKYRITQKGIGFLKGRITVPRFAFIYGNEVRRFSYEPTTFTAAAGDKFDFDEIFTTEVVGASQEEDGTIKVTAHCDIDEYQREDLRGYNAWRNPWIKI
jgi:hypothetical protein